MLGWVEEEALAPLCRGAELAFYLSRHEGFGLPPLECLACGTPVIVNGGLGLDDAWPAYPYKISEPTEERVAAVASEILLVGQAPTEALRMKIVDITKATEKVRVVHDEMTIAAPNSYMTRSSDSLITAKVKGSLFGIKGQEGFDPTRVKVVTENGIVYLMGILYRTEADAVATKASRVKGVQKVVKLFEYLD